MRICGTQGGFECSVEVFSIVLIDLYFVQISCIILLFREQRLLIESLIMINKWNTKWRAINAWAFLTYSAYETNYTKTQKFPRLLFPLLLSTE